MTDPSDSEPSLTSTIVFPTDGYGGSLYELQFNVPVYAANGLKIHSAVAWSDIDDFYQDNAITVTVSSIAFTTSMMTLLNIIAITPPHRRKLPIYKLMLIALLLHALAELCEIMAYICSPAVSAYMSLTMDVQSVTFTTRYKSIVWIFNIATATGFGFLQICLYLQGKQLLVWLHIHHPYCCSLIKITLVMAGIAAFGLETTFLILQILSINYDTAFDAPLMPVISQAQFITYDISIGGWSMVFFVSAMTILYRRKKSMLIRDTFYESVLNLISTIGLRSFIIPSKLPSYAKANQTDMSFPSNYMPDPAPISTSIRTIPSYPARETYDINHPFPPSSEFPLRLDS
jgi:hypothetical protein